MISTLLERESEMATLDQLLHDLTGGKGGVCLISGPAGIGKTALLHHLRASKPATVNLLESTCTPISRDLPFTVLRDWFEVAAHRSPVGAEPFDGPAERFRRLGEQSRFSPGDLSYAARWALESMCERAGPQLLVVEDAHWADTESLQALELLLPGIADLPVLVVLTVRSTESTLGGVLDRIGRDATLIEPEPLSVEAVGHLTDRHAPASSPKAVHELTGGVPFLVIQLLGHEGDGPPRTVVSSARARLEELDPGAVEVMRAVCVFNGTGDLPEVADLAERSPLQTAMHLRELYAAGLVASTAQESPTALHPLVRTAILHEIDPVTLSDLHLRAAWILRRAGFAEAQVSAHLLQTYPGNSPQVRDTLREQGLHALTTGANEIGLTHLKRAMIECPLTEESAELVATTARAHARLGEVDQAFALYQQAADLAADPDAALLIRAEAGHGLVNTGRIVEARILFQQLLGELGPRSHPATRRSLVASAALVGALEDPRAEIQPLIDQVLEQPETMDTHADKAVLAVGATALAFLGVDHASAAGLNERASYQGSLISHDASEDFVPMLVAANFGWCEDWSPALQLADRFVEEARSASSLLSFATASTCRGELRLQTGDFANALTDFETALGLRSRGWQALEASALNGAIECHLARGDFDRVGHYVNELRDRDDQGPDRARTLLSMSYHQVGLGQLNEALRLAQEAGRVAGQFAPGPAVIQWRRAEILLLHSLGQRSLARSAAQAYQQVAEAWGASRVLAEALYLSGLVRPRAERADYYERALSLAPAPFGGRLRATIQTGLVDLLLASTDPRVLRRAAELAEEASSYATEQSVVDLVTRTTAQLKRLGRQARGGPSSLTPGERQVVALALAGRSNQEIATALFVTRKTVEAYLSTIYRKLGISRRGELAAAMERPADGLTLL